MEAKGIGGPSAVDAPSDVRKIESDAEIMQKSAGGEVSSTEATLNCGIVDTKSLVEYPEGSNVLINPGYLLLNAARPPVRLLNMKFGNLQFPLLSLDGGMSNNDGWDSEGDDIAIGLLELSPNALNGPQDYEADAIGILELAPDALNAPQDYEADAIGILELAPDALNAPQSNLVGKDAAPKRPLNFRAAVGDVSLTDEDLQERLRANSELVLQKGYEKGREIFRTKHIQSRINKRLADKDRIEIERMEALTQSYLTGSRRVRKNLQKIGYQWDNEGRSTPISHITDKFSPQKTAPKTPAKSESSFRPRKLQDWFVESVLDGPKVGYKRNQKASPGAGLENLKVTKKED